MKAVFGRSRRHDTAWAAKGQPTTDWRKEGRRPYSLRRSSFRI